MSAEPAGSAPGGQARRSQRARLQLAVRRVDGSGVCAVRLFLRGGARCQRHPGDAWLTGRMLGEGSARRDWRALAEEVEDRGMALATFGAADALGVSIDGVAGDWQRALELAAEVVLEPSFPEDRFDWARCQAEAELTSLADQPEVVTAWAHQRQVYGHHPLASPLQGTAASLETASTERCRALHSASLTWGLGVVVTGDVPEEQARRRVQELFADLEGEAAALPEPVPAGGDEHLLEVPVPGDDQCHVLLGALTVDRWGADLPALDLLGVILGAGEGLSGRLPMRLREERGLAYSVSVQTAQGCGMDPGRLAVYAGVADSAAELAVDLVRAELGEVCVRGVTEQEHSEALGYLIGSEPFTRETARHWAELLADGLLYGLPYEDPSWMTGRWSAVGGEDLRAVAARWLDPGRLQVTIGRPAAGEGDGALG